MQDDVVSVRPPSQSRPPNACCLTLTHYCHLHSRFGFRVYCQLSLDILSTAVLDRLNEKLQLSFSQMNSLLPVQISKQSTRTPHFFCINLLLARPTDSLSIYLPSAISKIATRALAQPIGLDMCFRLCPLSTYIAEPPLHVPLPSFVSAIVLYLFQMCDQ